MLLLFGVVKLFGPWCIHGKKTISFSSFCLFAGPYFLFPRLFVPIKRCKGSPSLLAAAAAPLLSDAVSGLPALILASLDALPDFSAADWLGKFEREGGGAASGVMSLCGGALEAVATHLDELEKNIRSIQQSEQHQQQQRQQQQQQQQKQRQQEDSADAAQGVAEMLAAARQKMDEEDERVFSQMKYHGEQLVIGELQQMIATVKNIMLGIKYAAYSDTAVQHDLQVRLDPRRLQKPMLFLQFSVRWNTAFFLHLLLSTQSSAYIDMSASKANQNNDLFTACIFDTSVHLSRPLLSLGSFCCREKKNRCRPGRSHAAPYAKTETV